MKKDKPVGKKNAQTLFVAQISFFTKKNGTQPASKKQWQMHFLVEPGRIPL